MAFKEGLTAALALTLAACGSRAGSPTATPTEAPLAAPALATEPPVATVVPPEDSWGSPLNGQMVQNPTYYAANIAVDRPQPRSVAFAVTYAGLGEWVQVCADTEPAPGVIAGTWRYECEADHYGLNIPTGLLNAMFTIYDQNGVPEYAPAGQIVFEWDIARGKNK